MKSTEEEDSSIDPRLVAAKVDIFESNTSPAIECIVRELFRIYEPICYRQSYGRGAGHALNACPDDAPDQSGLICYPKCRDKYIGVGPVCWEDCTPLTAVGFFCVGSETVQYSSDAIKKSCPSCLERVQDSSVSYQTIFFRKSYGRGVGKPMVCSREYEQNGALCYPYCNPGYHGVGPVCWQNCPSSQPISCSFGCSITSADCQNFIIDIIAALIPILDIIKSILHSQLGVHLIEMITDYLIQSATNNDWISVAGNMTVLSDKFAETVMATVSKKCDYQPFDTMESAVKNASFLLTAVNYNDTSILKPFIRHFDISMILNAFDHALCNLPDNFVD